MAETIRDVIIKLTLQQQDTRIQAPDISAAAAELADIEAANAELHEDAMRSMAQYEDQATQVYNQIADEVERVNETLLKHTDIVEDGSVAAGIAKEIQQELTEANVRLGEAMKQVGEGAFTAARGVALLVASNSQDAQEMLKTIAKFQGAFDIFKGGVDVLKGVTEAMKIMRQTGQMTAAMNSVLATSNVAVEASAYGAAGGMTAMQAAAGPWALAALAVGAGLTLLISLLADTEEAMDATTEAEEEFGATTSRLSRLLSGGAANDIAKIADPYRSLGDQIARSREELERLATLSRTRATRLEGADDSTRAGILAEELEIYRAMGSAAAEVHQRKLDANEAARDALLSEKERLQTAKEAVETEKERLQQIDAQLGLLSDADFAVLQQLGQKVQGGGRLSREELQLTQRLGGQALRPFVEEQAALYGAERPDVLGLFGVSRTAGIDKAQAALDALDRSGTRSQEIEQKLKQLNEQDELSTKLLLQYLDEMQRRSAAVEYQVRQLHNRNAAAAALAGTT